MKNKLELGTESACDYNFLSWVSPCLTNINMEK